MPNRFEYLTSHQVYLFGWGPTVSLKKHEKSSVPGAPKHTPSATTTKTVPKNAKK
jgi:hypothetical protein